MMPIQPGDVEDICANVEELIRHHSYKPDTEIKEGVKKFVEWYRTIY